MDWDKLRIFHAVADAGSLTHAGDTLHLLHESCGVRSTALTPEDFTAPAEAAARILRQWGLLP